MKITAVLHFHLFGIVDVDPGLASLLVVQHALPAKNDTKESCIPVHKCYIV